MKKLKNTGSAQLCNISNNLPLVVSTQKFLIPIGFLPRVRSENKTWLYAMLHLLCLSYYGKLCYQIWNWINRSANGCCAANQLRPVFHLNDAIPSHPLTLGSKLIFKSIGPGPSLSLTAHFSQAAKCFKCRGLPFENDYGAWRFFFPYSLSPLRLTRPGPSTTISGGQRLIKITRIHISRMWMRTLYIQWTYAGAGWGGGGEGGLKLETALYCIGQVEGQFRALLSFLYSSHYRMLKGFYLFSFVLCSTVDFLKLKRLARNVKV